MCSALRNMAGKTEISTQTHIFFKGLLQLHWFIRPHPVVYPQSYPWVTNSCNQFTAKNWRILNLWLHRLCLPTGDGSRSVINVSINSEARVIMEPKTHSESYLTVIYYYRSENKYAFLSQTWKGKMYPRCVTEQSAGLPTSHLRLLGRQSYRDQSGPPTFCSGNQPGVPSAVGYSQAPLCLLLTDFSKTTHNCDIHLRESRFITNTCLSKSLRMHKQVEDRCWKEFRLSPYFLPKILNPTL